LKSSRKNKKKQPDHALGHTFGRSAFTKMENLQTYTQSTNNQTKFYYNQPKIFTLSLTHPPYPYRLQQGETEEEMSTKWDTEERDKKEREKERSLP
jgi:hypothetical protein